MHVADHHSLDEINLEARTAPKPREAIRLRAIAMAMQGWTSAKISEACAVTPRAVRGWVHAYNLHGLEGVRATPRPGQGAKLKEDQLRAFFQRVEAGPTPEDGVAEFRGKDLQRVLKEEFGVDYHLASVYRLLHDDRYAFLRPRPKHPKQDPEAVKAFREDTPLLSRPGGRSSRRRGSNSASGTKTRRGSGKRTR